MNLSPLRGREHRQLRIGGWVPFSTVDHPGRFGAVVFVQGCPWRCGYCHNPHLQSRRCSASVPLAWSDVLSWLASRRGLLDSVVFSGGEPLVDPSLKQAVQRVKSLGFEVALHTAGMYWDRLRDLVSDVDWVGLDVKAPLDDELTYERVTGAPLSAWATLQSLEILQQHAVNFECRTTVHPQWLSMPDLVHMADDLAARGVQRWVLQRARPLQPHADQVDEASLTSDIVSSAVLAQLQQRIAHVVLR